MTRLIFCYGGCSEKMARSIKVARISERALNVVCWKFLIPVDECDDSR